MIRQVNVATLLFCLALPYTASGRPSIAEGASSFTFSSEKRRNIFSPTSEEQRSGDELATNYKSGINLQDTRFNESNSLNYTLNETDHHVFISDDNNTVNGDYPEEKTFSEFYDPFFDGFQPFSNPNEDSDLPDLSRISAVSEPFNMEGSEIGDAAFVVPDEPDGVEPELPAFQLPRRTFALTVDDGQVIHKDMRKDNGEYAFSYTSADGSRRKEEGRLVTAANGQRVMTVKGSYDYRTPDGQRFRVNYQADTDGYRIINNTPVGTDNGLSWGRPTVVNKPNTEVGNNNGFSWDKPTSRPYTQLGNNNVWGKPTVGIRPNTEMGYGFSWDKPTVRPNTQLENTNSNGWGKPTSVNKPNIDLGNNHGYGLGNPTIVNRPNTQLGNNNGFGWGKPTIIHKPNTQFSNNNSFNGGKPTTNKRPVYMKRPVPQIRPQSHQMIHSAKPSGGRTPLVKPTFNIPISGKPRPDQTRPLYTG